MFKKLVLFGASNFGDEVVQLFRDINQAAPQPEWDIIGFLDDNAAMTGGVRDGVPVLGTREWLGENDLGDVHLVCTIGDPRVKTGVVELLRTHGAQFATGIHPTVALPSTVVVGEGTILTAGAIFTTNITIGRHVVINLACTIGHNTAIGDYATINPGVNVAGDVTIEEGALLGQGACVIEKLTVGAYSIVGAGSVVVRDVPARVTAYGNPARVRKEHAD